MSALALEGLTIERLRNAGLGDHPDVDLTGATPNDILAYDGTDWIPASSAPPASHALTFHSDVVISAPATNHVLQYDGANWINVASPTLAGDLNMGGNNITNVGTYSGGAITSSGDITATGVFISAHSNGLFRRSVDNDIVVISGGTSVSSGANITLYGGIHANKAKDIRFRADAVDLLYWDNSTGIWSFQGNPVSMGALTATTASFTGNSDVLYLHPSTGTSAVNIRIDNTGSRVYLGVDSSVGNRFSGSSAYAIFFGTNVAVALELATNNTVRFQIASGGSADFKGNAVSMGLLTVDDKVTGASTLLIYDTTSAGSHIWRIAGSQKLELNSGGNLIFAGNVSIARSVDTGELYISGGTGVTVGANIRLFGSSHATQAGDIQFLKDSNLKLSWDQSADLWSFHNHPASMGAVTATSITIDSGSSPVDLTLTDSNDRSLIIRKTSITNSVDFLTTVGGEEVFIRAQEDGQYLWFGTQNTEALRINSSQNVLIGTTTAATGNPRLDVLSGAYLQLRLKQWAVEGDQRMALTFQQRLVAEEGYIGIAGFANVSVNRVFIGGGIGQFNATEEILFYTAANTTTLTGTLAADITGVGGSSLFHARGDVRVATLGTFDGTSVPQTDYIMRYNGSKWVAAFLQTQFGPGDGVSQINGDGTTSAFVYSGPTLSGAPTPNPSAAPIITSFHKAILIDMSAYALGATEAYVLDYSINGGAYTSGAIITTSTNVIHTSLTVGSTYAYKFKIRGASDTPYSSATSATNPLNDSSSHAFGTVLAADIVTTNLAAISADIGDITAGTIKVNVIIEAEQLIANKIGMGPDSSPAATATVSLVHNRSDSVDSSHFVNTGQFTPQANNLRFQGLTSRPKLFLNSKTGIVFERMTIGSPSWVDLSNAGQLAEGYGLRIYDLVTGGPGITTQYGIKIEDITLGGTKYAIYTGTGLVRFGGALTATTVETTSGDPRFLAGILAPGINTPGGYFKGWAANADWPFQLGMVYDASYVDQYIVFNATLSGTRASPTATKGGSHGSAWIRHDPENSVLDFGVQSGASSPVAVPTRFSVTTSGIVIAGSLVHFTGTGSKELRFESQSNAQDFDITYYDNIGAERAKWNWNEGSNDLTYSNVSASNILVLHFSGNVLVGTATNVAGALQIVGSVGIGPVADPSTRRLLFSTETSPNAVISTSNNFLDLKAGGPTNNAIRLWTGTVVGSETERMSINSSGIISSSSQPRAKAIRSGDQSVPSLTAAKVAWNGTDVFDVGGLHSPSSNNTRMTIPTGGDGFWMFHAVINWQQTLPFDKEQRTHIFKNGTQVTERSYHLAQTGNIGQWEITYFDAAAAGDYYEVGVQNVWSTSINILAAKSYFIAAKVW